MQHINISKYMRNAVASYTNKKIDFKTDNYVNIPFEDLQRGRFSIDVFNTLMKKKSGDEEEFESNNQAKSFNVLISFKTIKTHFDGQERVENDMDELTGVYFIPAKLDAFNQLSFEINRLPWIPRDFLEPMTEPLLSFGNQSDYDTLQSDLIGRKHTLKSWNDYLMFATEFF